MFNRTQALRQYLTRRQETIDSESPSKTQNLNLFNEKTFYRAFIKDMLNAKKEVIIYSPFVSKFRTDFFKSTIEKLRHRNIEIFIFTRPIGEHDSALQPQIECALKRYEELGVSIFYLEGSIHEKLAIIDREILWEGSLNILSQRTSHEMMRRTEEGKSATQVMNYLGLNIKLAEDYKIKYERLRQSLMSSSKQNLKMAKVLLLAGLTPILIWLFIYFGDMVLSSGGASFVISLVKLFSHN